MFSASSPCSLKGCLAQHLLDYFSMNVGEAEVAALAAVGEALVVDA